MDVIIVLVFILVLTLVLIKVWMRTNASNLEREEMERQEQVHEVDYNGHTLYLTESDQARWKTLNNSERRQIHLRTKYAIREGLLVKVTDNEGRTGLISRQEAIAKGIIK